MPRAVKGEIWPKRLPRPGPLGSKVSKLWKSIIRPSSGRAPTRKTTSASSRGRSGSDRSNASQATRITASQIRPGKLYTYTEPIAIRAAGTKRRVRRLPGSGALAQG